MFQKYQFDPGIANAVKSPDKAFMIEYMVWSIRDKQTKPDFYKDFSKDGRFYMWDTYKNWHVRMPWLGESTIRKYLSDLRKDEWIFTAFLARDNRDRTLFYTVDLDLYSKTVASFWQSHVLDSSTSHVLDSSTSHVLDNSNSTCSELANVPLTKTLTKTPTNKIGADATPPPVVRVPKYDDHDFLLGGRWLEHAVGASNTKPYPSWTQVKFAEEISKIKRLCSLSHEQLVAVFEFVRVDDFWKPNALSPNGLIKKSKNNDRRKIDNIIAAMKEKRDGSRRQQPKLHAVPRVAQQGGADKVYDLDWGDGST